jgi:hypothetical protein
MALRHTTDFLDYLLFHHTGGGISLFCLSAKALDHFLYLRRHVTAYDWCTARFGNRTTRCRDESALTNTGYDNQRQ